jgi:hypothetical protein
VGGATLQARYAYDGAHAPQAREDAAEEACVFLRGGGAAARAEGAGSRVDGVQGIDTAGAGGGCQGEC